MFVCIAFIQSLSEAGRIHSLLESEGFHPVPMDYFSHITFAGVDKGYKIETPKTEADAARSFLKEMGFGRYLEK